MALGDHLDHLGYHDTIPSPSLEDLKKEYADQSMKSSMPILSVGERLRLQDEVAKHEDYESSVVFPNVELDDPEGWYYPGPSCDTRPVSMFELLYRGWIEPLATVGEAVITTVGEAFAPIVDEFNRITPYLQGRVPEHYEICTHKPKCHAIPAFAKIEKPVTKTRRRKDNR